MEEPLRHYRSSHDLNQCGVYEGQRFRSRWFLGLERGMEWLRLVLEGPAAWVRVYACDTPPGEFGAVESAPALERRAGDLLLYGVRGRYLAFTVEPADGLRGFTLSFPGRSIAQGLPFVLQGDEALRRLLAVYQSGYQDLNRRMRDFPQRLDPTHPEALPQLPRWIGARRWTRDAAAAKKLLPHAPLLARMRGTRRCLLLLSELVTGCTCRVVEAWQAGQDSRKGTFGEGVTVLVPARASREDVQHLRALLPDFIPLGVPYTLIHLEDGAPMDGHSYLEENTVLSEQGASLLDGPDGGEVVLA